jgi:DNA-directed RNA polymerase specialized sigma24 family protein
VDERARAIEAVYRDRYGRFCDVLISLTGSREQGRDAVQETFAQALRDRHSFRGEGSLEAWIWRIAIRTAGRHRPEHGIGSFEPSTNGSEPVSPPWSDVDPDLAAAVRSLSPRQRLMVFLHYFADLPYAHIAEICAVREGTVAATLAHARSALLDALRKEHQR